MREISWRGFLIGISLLFGIILQVYGSISLSMLGFWQLDRVPSLVAVAMVGVVFVGLGLIGGLYLVVKRGVREVSKNRVVSRKILGELLIILLIGIILLSVGAYQIWRSVNGWPLGAPLGVPLVVLGGILLIIDIISGIYLVVNNFLYTNKSI
ncbi:MAG: hypothetical protein ACW98X_22395 [Promethearchaeota archaeon]